MREFSVKEAKSIGDKLGIDWSKIPLEQFRMGLKVELEHGTQDPDTDITHDDSIKTGKIALAHLREYPLYYTDLDAMEKKAKAQKEAVAEIKKVVQEGLFLAQKNEDPSGLHERTAQILAVGLHQDLPDDINEAVDFLVDLLKTMAMKRRSMLLKALRAMGRRTKAMTLLKTVKTEY
jgi:hypothetical protein